MLVAFRLPQLNHAPLPVAMTSVDRLRFTFSRLRVRLTPAVIDHLAFPHLVDLIFYYAPLSSLVLMGQTCREWRKRVKAELYHLRDFSAKRKPPWWNNKLSGSTSVIHHYQFTTVRGVSLQVTDTGYIRRCRVLDLGSRPIIVRPERVLRVDTLRISQTPLISINHMGRLGPFSCSRLVLDNHFALNTRREVRKLVVNYRGGNFRAREPRLGPECSNSSFKVHEFVFIVHPTADTKTRGMAQYEGEKNLSPSTD